MLQLDEESHLMGHLDQPKAAAKPTYPELSLVRLNTDVQVGETTVPAGSLGTIVYVYREGQAYEVEFFQPIAATLTLTAADLAQ